MRKEYQTPEIEIIEFDAEVQMKMTLSGTESEWLGDNNWDINDTGWAD